MGLAPLLAFALQRDLCRGTVIDPDPELLTGIRAVLIFLHAAVIVIVKIQAADKIGSCLCHMAVQRQQMVDPHSQHLDLGIRHLVFQLVTVFCFFLFGHSSANPSLFSAVRRGCL